MSDLISRADAIEALCHNCAYYTDAQCKTDSGYWCESGAMIRVDIPSAETSQNLTEPNKELKGSDLISREDAVGCCEDGLLFEEIIHKIKALPSAVCDDCIWHVCNYNKFDWDALPSAEAEPTVIRSKTLLPTKDFKEWAKRIREVNPNAVVIPCDAEVVSAEAAHGWIPCSKRLPEDTAEWKAYLTCNDAGTVTTTFWADGWNCWRNPDGEVSREYELTNIVAWMPLPKPYREDGEA